MSYNYNAWLKLVSYVDQNHYTDSKITTAIGVARGHRGLGSSAFKNYFALDIS